MSFHHVLMSLAWLAGWVLFWRAPRLPRRDDDGTADDVPGAVTIIIPARNEEISLPLLLGDLAEHRPAGSRVLVVDDRSEDDTAGVARAFDFVEVVTTPPPEEGWVGKTWACAQGVRRVEDGVIVFLDADVRIRHDAIARALAACRQRGGLLTVWPHHDVERPYEHLSAMGNVATLSAVGAASLVPPRRPQAGFGPFMVMSLADYRKVGGHAAVRTQVIEDFGLARRFSAAELPVVNYTGGKSVGFRMYPGGLGELINGWTKNFGPGVWHVSWLRLAFLVAWLAVGAGLLGWGGGITRTVPQILYGLYVVQMYVMFRQVGRFGIVDAILYPLHIYLALALLLRSFWRTYVLRTVTWKGRSVSTGRRDGGE